MWLLITTPGSEEIIEHPSQFCCILDNWLKSVLNKSKIESQRDGDTILKDRVGR